MSCLSRACKQHRTILAPLVGAAVAVLLLSNPSAQGQKADPDPIQIGSVVESEPGSPKAKGAIESLQSFIKEETGSNNEIVQMKDWRALSEKMKKGDYQLGVFHGYEFGWAQEKYPGLKPLSVAINVHRYPTVHVLIGKGSQAKDFAGLQGQSLSLAAGSQPYVRMFLDSQAQARGKKTEAFFSKLTTPENVEDALDDAVDGVVQATVVERATLEAFKRRKPGRFNQLKEVAVSHPFPPIVVAYQEKALSEATLRRFQDGLMNASKKEKGQMMLTLFRLTGFEAIPEDFAKSLAETRKLYPLEDKPK